ncbi:hypothetical protein COU80_05605 [Candidatus Peregrinibacteria bacterium CG10_big_fil_rev_8_21_14_0_10_55_24]|nr:MAG: hypothetical protein COU80_05605 [Candidatus Peregrinibacteria bacterium CG10_big_fil_rev_8_21_14_0_10_55_24]
MIRLPASLERRLQELFPKVRERERFVADVLNDALAEQKVDDDVQAVGGTLHLFTDGGSRGNPGQAAIGCLLEDPVEGKILREHAERIGITTNNVAEYRALIEGLKIARRYHPNRLICHLDSELIVKQLNGQYRVKMPALQEYVDEISELVQEIPTVEFTYIPRADNYRADALVNRALDTHPSPSYERPR